MQRILQTRTKVVHKNVSVIRSECLKEKRKSQNFHQHKSRVPEPEPGAAIQL